MAFTYFSSEKLPVAKRRVSLEQRLYAIRVSVVIQAFCPAQTSVFVDRNEARNPLLHIALNVTCKVEKQKVQETMFHLN